MRLSKNLPKKTIITFFLTYFSVLLPMLFVSFLVTYITSERLNIQINEKLTTRLERTADTLDSIQLSYSNKALQLSNNTDLLYDKMANPVTAYKSLQVLSHTCSYDLYAEDALLDYGDETVFVPKGYSRLSVYLDKDIGLDAKNREIVKNMLDTDTFGSCLAEKSDTDGFVVFHYPARVISYARGAKSINYLFDYKTFASFFNALCDTENVYIHLTFDSGQSLCMHGRDGMIAMIPPAEYPTELSEFEQVRKEIKSSGIKLDVLYEKSDIYGTMQRSQLISYIILACSLLCSTILSIVISNRRLRQLADLKKEIQSDFSGTPKMHNSLEYTFLNQELRAVFSDKNRKIYSLNDQIRRQTASMLFNGTITERETLNLYLRPCGMELFEEYFFVGGLIFDDDAVLYRKVCDVLKNDIYCDIEEDGKNILFFLVETTSTDDAGQNRMTIVRNIHHILVEMGNTNVRIGASCVYNSLAMAGLAFQEAKTVIEKMIAGTLMDVCAIWERVEPETAHLLRIGDSDRMLLSNALEHRDGAAASKILSRLARIANAANASPENQRYFRYQILRILVDGQEENEQLIEQAMSTKLSIKDFCLEAERIIKLYYTDDKQDKKFDCIVEYIKNHYQESTLSAEEVATHCEVDKTRLSRIFHARVNMSYIEYLTCLRMEKARELLTDTNLPVTEICLRVGYLDISSFRKKFKSLYHQNLSEFRESQTKRKGNDA